MRLDEVRDIDNIRLQCYIGVERYVRECSCSIDGIVALSYSSSLMVLRRLEYYVYLGVVGLLYPYIRVGVYEVKRG